MPTDRPYTGYLQRQTDSAYARGRSGSDSYDQPWAGPFQHSAVDLMNAAG